MRVGLSSLHYSILSRHYILERGKGVKKDILIVESLYGQLNRRDGENRRVKNNSYIFNIDSLKNDDTVN